MANLRGVSLVRSNLQNGISAELRGANLNGANLYGAEAVVCRLGDNLFDACFPIDFP